MRRFFDRTARALVALAVVAALGAPGSAAAAPPKVGDTAPEFTLGSIQGGKTTLSAVAEKGPVVLVMLRGFPGYQCPVCTAQVADLVGKAKAFEKANARVVLVYPGSSDGLAKFAAEFVRGKTLPENFTFLIDPGYAMTDAYGLRWNAPNETAYPSAFVLDNERKVKYAKVSKSHGGRAKAAELLAAIKP